MNADDLLDWIADRQKLLIDAWTPELTRDLMFERPYAEAFAEELHETMMATLLGGGDERNFLKAVARSDTGLKQAVELEVATRFHHVTLLLARAAIHHREDEATRALLPYRYTSVVGDHRTNPGHLPLAGIILHRDHTFWSRWHPPLDMTCRCMTLLTTTLRLSRRGLALISEEELAKRETRLVGGWPPAFQPLLEFRS